MARRLHVTQNDTQAVLTVDLQDRPTGLPIDVSGVAVVRLYLRLENTIVVLVTVVGVKLPGQTLTDGTLDATVTTPGQGGRVQFSLPINFTSLAPGYYEGEIEITMNTGLIQTVYDRPKISLRADF